MRCFIPCSIVLAVASPLRAQDVGDWVVVVAETEAELKTDGRVVATIRRGSFVRVDKTDGDRLRVTEWGGARGFIERRHVLPLEDAMRLFTKAISESPTADDYQARGNIWIHKGKFTFALRDFTEAIRRDPRQPDIYNDRGVAWERIGEYDKAIADYNKAISLNPYFQWAYSNRGNACVYKGEYDRGIADYKRAIRLNPNDAVTYNSMAWLHAVCSDAAYRDGKKATEYATRACELADWQNGSFLDTLAAACAERGDFDHAVKWEEKALSLVDDGSKGDCRARLELYRSGKPYRQEPRKSEGD